MFCPVCRDEFRPGFDRCARCDVGLVESLEDVAQHGSGGPARAGAESARTPVPMVEFCGFLSLEEAREARDRLRGNRIRSEIVIREASASFDPGRPPVEEFWLKVERNRYGEVVTTLGFDEASPGAGGDETFACGECGAEVADEESFCPECGARFEDD